MPKGNYVNNSMNRSLGRVGMTRGSAVVSSGSSGSSSYGYASGSSSTYVARGSAGVSSGSSGSSSYGYASGSSSSYVDNAMNRSLGRVGLPRGTAVHSADSAGSSTSSSSSYVDNAMNRSLDRVGLPKGTAVHSKSGSSSASRQSSDTYVDNAMNRSLDRVGMPKGTAVHSKSGFSSASSQSSDTYVDNPSNRKLGRVGMERGTAVVSRSAGSSRSSNNELVDALRHMELKSSNNTKKDGKPPNVKVYKDNPFNRKHERVGKPLGTHPISKKNECYRDTEHNRALGRVGEPWGTKPDPRQGKSKETEDFRKFFSFLNHCQDGFQDYDVDDGYDDDGVMADVREYYRDHQNRQEMVENWQEKHATWQPRTDPEVVSKHTGSIIAYEELRLEKKIGQGTFGDVFFGYWNGTVVAIKKLHQQSLSRRKRQEFSKEVRLISNLNHENIVGFLGACIDPPELCIVMEFMDVSMFDALHIKEIEFDDCEKLIMMRQMCDGLSYLHTMDVAHCDIKSHNVLLSIPEPEGDDNNYRDIVAKLSDFGLSLVKSECETSMSRGKKFRNIGTPRYSAPEILRGEMIDRSQYMKADIYSMGILLLEVSTEDEPFSQFNLRQLQKQVGEQGLLPTIPDDLDGNLVDQLKKCLKFQPEYRPTARQLLQSMIYTEHIVELH